MIIPHFPLTFKWKVRLECYDFIQQFMEDHERKGHFAICSDKEVQCQPCTDHQIKEK